MLRKWLLALITLTTSTIFALIIGELFLVVYSSAPKLVDQMDDGLIRYHSRYGWSLTPGWTGQHTHTDYSVQYGVNQVGLRNNANASQPATRSKLSHPNSIVSKHLIVGDSFTFGLGVNNQETFTALLEHQNPNQVFYNGAVPGYSPEQILLRANDLSQALAPDTLIAVIYLGNDLIDIGLEFPVQAEFPKPFARISDSGWELTGLPVPKKQKTAAHRQHTLASFVVEPGSEHWLAGTQTGQRLINLGVFNDTSKMNMARVNASLDLLNGVLSGINDIPAKRRVIVLLPGSVAVTEPESLTGRYQQYLDQQIKDRASQIGLETWSLVEEMGQHTAPSTLYYVNDGHLTAGGHRLVADAIRANLSEG